MKCRLHKEHPFEGGSFSIKFERGITATIRPKHGTVLGMRSTKVTHHTEPITQSNGWQQVGIALVHKQAVVTGCTRVFEAGQRAKVMAKALSSSVASIAESALEKASEVMVAVEKAEQAGTQLPDTLRASVKRKFGDMGNGGD
jgi:hypothetical protein